MFPIDDGTKYMQSVCEAELDVYVLIIAAEHTPEIYQPTVTKYIVVAVLSFVDAMHALFSQESGFWQRNGRGLTPEQESELRRIKKVFDRECHSSSGRLRKHIRNRFSAHKEPLTVETEIEGWNSLDSIAAPALFRAGVQLLHHVEKLRVWSWGRSARSGVVVGVGSVARSWARERTAKEQTGGLGPYAFDLRELAQHKIAKFDLEEPATDLSAAIAWVDFHFKKAPEALKSEDEAKKISRI